MKTLLTVFCFILWATGALAQSTMEARFQTSFTGSSRAIGSKALWLSDGNILQVGSTGDANTPQSSDIAVIKTDANGKVLWAKRYTAPNYTITHWWCGNKGPFARMEYAVDAVETADAYWVLGCYDRFDGPYPFPLCPPNDHLLSARFDAVLMKLRKSDGKVEYTRRYGGYNDSQLPQSLHATPDGGFVISGLMTSQWLFSGNPPLPFLIKVNASGHMEWSRVLNGFYQNNLALAIPPARKMPVAVMSNGNLVCAASTGDYTQVWCFSPKGDSLWSKQLDHRLLYAQIFDILEIGLVAVQQSFCIAAVERTNGNVGLVNTFTFAAAAFTTKDLFSIAVNLGCYWELTPSGGFVKASAFSWENPHSPPGNLAPLAYMPTYARALPNGNLLIAGAIPAYSVFQEYNPDLPAPVPPFPFNLNLKNYKTKSKWAFAADAYEYSNIPFSYDVPTADLKDNRLVGLTDNFKVGVRNLNHANGYNCLRPVHLPAFDINLSLSDVVLAFIAINDTGTLAMVEHPLSAGSIRNCPSWTLAHAMAEDRHGSPSEQQTAESPSLRTWPQPLVGERLFVGVEVRETDRYRLDLYDPIGRLVQTAQVSLEAGQQTFEWSLPDLKAGMYYLTLSDGQGRRLSTRRIVKP